MKKYAVYYVMHGTRLRFCETYRVTRGKNKGMLTCKPVVFDNLEDAVQVSKRLFDDPENVTATWKVTASWVEEIKH